MTISFIDETEKTKDKQTQKRIRKQHHNKELLQNYFEWGKQEEVVLKYKINSTCNNAWISEETLPQLNKERSDCPATTQTTECQLTSEKKLEQNNSKSTIIVSDFFGLKLDVDDFISTYEMILAQYNECKSTK
ncbi:hypothetical protein ABK040_004914 [Willaertia magna]